ncbi:hypothetical protein JHK85_000973 [Glycine max]|nr:hypothetical protein JHK85_000973 [Glycine max]KAG5088327.1 hypothetical protein JHK86_000939 [Glycine max]
MAIGSVPFINLGLFIHDVTSVRFLKKLSTRCLFTVTERQGLEDFDIISIKMKGRGAITNYDLNSYEVNGIMKKADGDGGSAVQLYAKGCSKLLLHVLKSGPSKKDDEVVTSIGDEKEVEDFCVMEREFRIMMQ